MCIQSCQAVVVHSTDSPYQINSNSHVIHGYTTWLQIEKTCKKVYVDSHGTIAISMGMFFVSAFLATATTQIPLYVACLMNVTSFSTIGKDASNAMREPFS
jgi:hypothetical protein